MGCFQSKTKQIRDVILRLRYYTSSLYDLTCKVGLDISRRRAFLKYENENDIRVCEEQILSSRAEMVKLIDTSRITISELNGLMEGGYEIPEKERREGELAISTAKSTISDAEDAIIKAKEELGQI